MNTIIDQSVHFIAKKTEELHGIQVTPDNMEDLARWCKGIVIREGHAVWIRVPVPRPKNERRTRAYTTDWIVRTQDGMLRIYKHRELIDKFNRVGD